MKNRIPVIILAIFAFCLCSTDRFMVWAVSVGTRLQPLVMDTNSGAVSIGTNVATRLVFTNAIDTSNTFLISASGSFTNNAVSILSNVTARGNLSVSGDVSRLPSFVILTALTNNDYAIGSFSAMVITNTTNNPTVFTGFTGGRDGKVLDIVNLTGSNIAILSQSALSAVSNRIELLGLDTRTNTTGNGSFSFIWLSYTNSWVLRAVTY